MAESGKKHLRDLMLAHQNKLQVALKDAELFDHPSAKGDVKEYDWGSFLGKFLPTRYQVSEAFVIDSFGSQSEQQDVVIYDRHYCPLFFEKGQSRYIPAESVYAVFEIKPELDRDNVIYAADKIASVRRLRRTSGAIVDRGRVQRPRDAFEILGGILTTRSGWNPPLGDPFEKALREATSEGVVDLGCALESGSFEAHYRDELVSIERSPSDLSLMFFMLRLFKRLQSLGTVTAIDLDAYGSSIDPDKEADA